MHEEGFLVLFLAVFSAIFVSASGIPQCGSVAGQKSMLKGIKSISTLK
jgi:hypothetical protein